MTLEAKTFRRWQHGEKNSKDKAEVWSLEPWNICWGLIQPHAEYPPILMSASWSAGTSLKLNGETSLHMPKALAMPRRVSLAFIKFVGKDSNLLKKQQQCSLYRSLHTFLYSRGICQNTMATVQTDQNSHKHCKYSSITETWYFLISQPGFRLIWILWIKIRYWSASVIGCQNETDKDIILLTIITFLSTVLSATMLDLLLYGLTLWDNHFTAPKRIKYHCIFHKLIVEHSSNVLKPSNCSVSVKVHCTLYFIFLSDKCKQRVL